MNDYRPRITDHRFLGSLDSEAESAGPDLSHGRNTALHIVSAWTGTVIAAVILEFGFWYSKL